MAALDEGTRGLLKSAQRTIQERNYKIKLGQMSQNARDWLARHPGAKVKIAFRHPPETNVVAAISDAIRGGFVLVNNEGLQLIKAMSPWGQDEPTLNMVRGVIDCLNLWPG